MPYETHTLARRFPAFAIWVAACLGVLATAVPAQADLARAMDAVRARDWDRAAAAVAGEAAPVQAVVEWHRLRAGQGSFEEYLAFLGDYADWPGIPLLRRRGEGKIPSTATDDALDAFFGASLPQTAAGVLRRATAAPPEAGTLHAIRAWREMQLDPETESVLLARFGQALADHQIARMNNLLWNGWHGAAARQRPRVPQAWRLLHDARVALQTDTAGVDARIDAVPDRLADDPGLAFDRMEWRARRGRTEGVVELFLDRSATAERLGRPERWAPRRRALAREFMQEGAPRRAYLLAAPHHLTGGVDFADLEWLAGYVALRKLDEPAAALAHFRSFRAGVESPISLGRAGYWEGRAQEALGDVAAAQAAYAFGAEFQTTFYGQLAAERGDLPPDPALTGQDVFPVARDSALARASVHRAGVALFEAGELALAARFFAHQAESLERGEIGRLLALTEQLDSAYVQLRIAKRAASMGYSFERAYFPLVDLDMSGRPDVSRELALAIARRESEFNPTVVSPAGARGLMQVMPGTARDTAAALGMSYSLSRLTVDPIYNARLGTAYLQELRDRFGDATIFVAVGYNAGPGRVSQWVDRFGDPYAGAIDPVDWIEHIPFRETRNYVMRVMESLAPYRARLSGESAPLGLRADLEAN